MDSTLLRSLRSSSNCSRMDGVILDLMISDLFSLRIEKKARTGEPQPVRVRTNAPGGGLKTLEGGNHRNVGLTERVAPDHIAGPRL